MMSDYKPFESYIGSITEDFSNPECVNYPWIPIKHFEDLKKSLGWGMWTGDLASFIRYRIYYSYPDLNKDFILNHWDDIYEGKVAIVRNILDAHAIKTILSLISAKEVNILITPNSVGDMHHQAHYVKKFNRPIAIWDDDKNDFIYQVNFNFFRIEVDKIIRYTRRIVFNHQTLEVSEMSILYKSGVWTYHALKNDFGWDVEQYLHNPIELIRCGRKTVQSFSIEKVPKVSHHIYGILITKNTPTTDTPNDPHYIVCIPAHHHSYIGYDNLADLVYRVKNELMNSISIGSSLASNYETYIPSIRKDLIENAAYIKYRIILTKDDDITIVKIYF